MQTSESLNDKINDVFYRIEERISPATAMKIVGVTGTICALICIYFIVDSVLIIRELSAELEQLMNE